MDWYDRLERFVVERRTPSAVITLAVIAAAVWGHRAVAVAGAAVEENSRKAQAAERALGRHKAWLRSLPVAEKRTWAFSVCRPGTSGTCTCEHWDDNVVNFAEVLPNGDVACHQTK